MVTRGASSLMKMRRFVVWIWDTTSGCGDYFGPDGPADGSSPRVSHLSSSSSSSSYHLRPLPPKNAQSRLAATFYMRLLHWLKSKVLTEQKMVPVRFHLFLIAAARNSFLPFMTREVFKSLIYCWVVLIISSGSYSIKYSKTFSPSRRTHLILHVLCSLNGKHEEVALIGVVVIIYKSLVRKYLVRLHLVCVCCSPQKMDKNRDGVVTLDEFILSCQEVFSLLMNLSCSVLHVIHYIKPQWCL